jgi:glutamate racemase
VEEGWADNDVTKRVTQIYLDPFKGKSIDTLILGCTHYPILKNVLQKVMGRNVALVDSAREVAKGAKDILDAGGLLNAKKARGIQRFFVSDEPNRFIKIGEKFLKRHIKCSKLK